MFVPKSIVAWVDISQKGKLKKCREGLAVKLNDFVDLN